MTLRNARFGQLQAAVFAAAAAYTGFQSWQLVGDWIRDGAGTARYVGLVLCVIPTLLLAWCAVRSLQQGVTVTADGLRVRNIVTTRTIPWRDVGGLSTGSTMAESPTGGGLEWWCVQVLLRDSERMVRIQGSFSRKRELAEAFAAQLRSLAPSSLHTGASMRAPRPVRPAAGDPTSTPRRYVVHSWAISHGGPGGVRRTIIPWSEVRDARVVETANALMTKRVSHLEVLTSNGPVALWATMRPIHQIDQVGQRVVSFARRPPS